MGLLDENGKVPRNKRSLVAQTLINAVVLDEQQTVDTTRTEEFCGRITAIHNGLSNLPEATTAGILAAVAPVIWRQSPEKEPRHDRT